METEEIKIYSWRIQYQQPLKKQSRIHREVEAPTLAEAKALAQAQCPPGFELSGIERGDVHTFFSGRRTPETIEREEEHIEEEEEM